MASITIVLRDLGRRIREVRKSRGLSQEELAYAAGISRTFMGTLEIGRKAPSVATIHRLASALEVPILQFFLPQGDSQREIISRIDALLADRRRTTGELKKAEDLVNTFLKKS